MDRVHHGLVEDTKRQSEGKGGMAQFPMVS
jgi:hypothetical protein